MKRDRAEIELLVSEKVFALTLKKIASPNEELIESGILTSITLAELAVELEKIFSIQLSFMEVNKENFHSAGTITNLVISKLN